MWLTTLTSGCVPAWVTKSMTSSAALTMRGMACWSGGHCHPLLARHPLLPPVALSRWSPSPPSFSPAPRRPPLGREMGEGEWGT
ncbi:Os09g0379500 [Oryza sativa Japonica Group]|uniref:Os09g0379500 protein n=2 Tax=Oryza sativa subsp. japonica TaxID=39947 RepID=Q0J251_ORYSJ|nr:hypothetical protein EE612_047462 [Oryza sativa]BAD26081.1 unknown protein [Oryza sativa Japonica Group]BAF24964.1 Os09g0379500 [Oryza sativa Japonica Group]BAT07835.1 Os09g0379500 [Oryza sativa Japonica Group]|eukprot:NP_001063050.1 Os09g0379500 [Oryza sativa Japonica Group]